MKKVSYILIFILLLTFNLAAKETQPQVGAKKTPLQKAEDYFQKGKFFLAELYYLKALKEEPDDFNANYNLGMIFYHHKAYKKAIQYLQTAYDINPKIDILFYIAACHVEVDNPKKGLSIYSNILKKEPNYAIAHLDAGNVGLRKLYNKYITIPHWEKFLLLRPDDSQAPNIRKALQYLKDPNTIIKPPSEEGKPGTSAGTPGTGTAEKDSSSLLNKIKGKDLESGFEERYRSKKKKSISTD